MLFAFPVDIGIPSDQIPVVDLRGRLTAFLKGNLSRRLREPELEDRRVHQVLVLLLDLRVSVLRVRVAVLSPYGTMKDPRVTPEILETDQVGLSWTASFRPFECPVDGGELGAEISGSLVWIRLDTIPRSTWNFARDDRPVWKLPVSKGRPSLFVLDAFETVVEPGVQIVVPVLEDRTLESPSERPGGRFVPPCRPDHIRRPRIPVRLAEFWIKAGLDVNVESPAEWRQPAEIVNPDRDSVRV
jgi:hypothetical protein